MRFKPRFTLKTLLLTVAIASIPLAWTSAQLRWIQERHVFRQAHERPTLFRNNDVLAAPWQLRIFGEHAYDDQTMTVDPGYLDEAKKLFPEVERFRVAEPEQPF
jgi:hypothetical protein